MMEYNGVDYIYVGDIGNNWDGHCRGINYEDMSIYRFPEPDLSRFRQDTKFTNDKRTKQRNKNFGVRPNSDIVFFTFIYFDYYSYELIEHINGLI